MMPFTHFCADRPAMIGAKRADVSVDVCTGG
jgi:hypothetical protein